MSVIVTTMLAYYSVGCVFPEADIIMYTNGSVVRNVNSACAFTVHCERETIKEECRAFGVTKQHCHGDLGNDTCYRMA